MHKVRAIVENTYVHGQIMEKTTTIFLELIHDDKFMFYFWGFLGMFNLFWDLFFFRSKVFSEEQLIEIDPKFQGIKSYDSTFNLITIALILVLMMTSWSSLDNWALTNYGRRFYPFVVFFTSALGVSQGVFALLRDVYPVLKMPYFRYTNVKVIHHTARYQIASSIAVFILSILSFFIIG